MNIMCPNCHRRLRVPDGAVGRRARCPACRNKFVVARTDDQMFETITGFVLEDSAVTRTVEGKAQTNSERH